MGTLGNSEAVKAAQGRERRPARPAASPAKETAEKRAADTPERELSAEEKFEARLRRSLPGISDEAVAALRKDFLRD